MKKVAVILSGCGVFDGSEIHEAVLTLLHIAKAGAQYRCFAPNREQLHTINHLTGNTTSPNRNILEEAARIARGDISPLEQLNVAEFDALIVPGGFGAAKNLCDFAVNGTQMTVHQDVLDVATAFAKANKPAGYLCIAPAMIPRIYEKQTKATIGLDADTAAALNTMGAQHVECQVNDIVIDEARKVVSTPAYMLAQSITEADAGIAKLVQAVLNLCD